MTLLAFVIVSIFILILLLLGILAAQKKVKGEARFPLKKNVRADIGPLGKAEFDIILEDPGDKKVAVAKCLRQIYDIGLADAYQVIDRAPGFVKMAVSHQEAEYVTARLIACGATASFVKNIDGR